MFRTPQNTFVEFEAKDPSGNKSTAKFKFKLLVVKCKQHGKKNREDLEGGDELITVPWNTQLNRIVSDYVEFEEGSDPELIRQIKWGIDGFDPLKSGFYELRGSLSNLDFDGTESAVSLPVLVLNKALPEDILANQNQVTHKIKPGEIITGLTTIDPVDDIHKYAMDPHPDVYLQGNVLVWKGTGMPDAKVIVTVHSTDRVGQTISRNIELYRRTDKPNDLIIYPNPSMIETNILVQIAGESDVSIRIYDAAGRLIHEESGRYELSFTRKVDLRHFSQGMYQVIVQVNREVLQGRIIKQ